MQHLWGERSNNQHFFFRNDNAIYIVRTKVQLDQKSGFDLKGSV